MESVETAYAERCETLVSDVCSLKQLVARRKTPVPFERLLRTAGEEIDPKRKRGWVKGQSWPDGATIYAPYELIGIDYRHDAGWDHETFHMSSIGTAAHADRERAIQHALLEVIENDATAAVEVFGFSDRLVEFLPELPGSDALQSALEKLARVGLNASFCRLRGAVDLPVIGCFVGRDVAGAEGSGTAYSAGFACRLRVEDAALSALLEAVQSRLTDIAGARDDISPEDFRPANADIGGWLPPSKLVRGSRVPRGEPLDLIGAALSEAGIEASYVFDLCSEPGLSVVRVLMPDMQSPASGAELRMGLTATRQLLG